jgi:glycine cleavage system H protein
MSIILDDLKYATTHEWAKVEEDGLVWVGISDFAQEQLGDVVYIELPELGRKVKAGEACAVIESVKAASDIFSPVTGEIIAVNADLTDAPQRVNEDSYTHWLFKVKASDSAELDTLLTAGKYKTATSST